MVKVKKQIQFVKFVIDYFNDPTNNSVIEIYGSGGFRWYINKNIHSYMHYYSTDPLIIKMARNRGMTVEELMEKSAESDKPNVGCFLRFAPKREGATDELLQKTSIWGIPLPSPSKDDIIDLWATYCMENIDKLLLNSGPIVYLGDDEDVCCLPQEKETPREDLYVIYDMIDNSEYLKKEKLFIEENKNLNIPKELEELTIQELKDLAEDESI